VEGPVTESQILTLNERVKTVSTYFANLSAALSAATATRVWVKADVDLSAILWVAGAVCLLLISSQVLYLLEATLEDAE
jgi:hypothetical protein